MSLVRWIPQSPLFSSLSSWVDDVFAEDGDFPVPMVKGVSIPAVNVTEGAKAFKLEVAAPGFKKEDFKLEVKNGYLMISGETKAEEEKKDEQYTKREFRYNSFTRSFALPENVKDAEIDARYNDGILLVTLPKAKTEQPEVAKTIKVK